MVILRLNSIILHIALPESIGVAIKTSDGAVVYVPDFTFLLITIVYRTSFNKLAEIAKGELLALLSESLGVNNTNRVHNDIPLFHKITEVLLNSWTGNFFIVFNRLRPHSKSN